MIDEETRQRQNVQSTSNYLQREVPVTTKILVVDDEPLICQLLSYQLGGAGYDVATLHDGREALERLLVVKPDLVLLDVMMPGISGWDVCRQIRACSNIPVIMLTAKHADTDVVTGLNNGADDYLSKPFSLPQLLARIEAVLRRSTPTPTPPRPARVARPALRDAAPTPPAPAPVLTLEPDVPEPAAAPAPAATTRLGERFAQARHTRRLTLHQVERACGVRWEFLQAVEQEHFGIMSRPQLRHALLTYSAYLNVDLSEFMGRPTQKQEQLHMPLALVATLVLMLAVIVGFYLF